MYYLFVFVFLFASCSQSSKDSDPIIIDARDIDIVDMESDEGTHQKDTSEIVDQGVDVSDTPKDMKIEKGPFDLKIKFEEERWVFIAVKDKKTGKQIAFKSLTKDDDLSQVVFPKLLEKDKSYELAIVKNLECVSEDKYVLYREINDVKAPFSLVVNKKIMEEVDYKACDVLHIPVDLPSGTYTHTQNILGKSSNQVIFEVSPSKRVYIQKKMVHCSGENRCRNALITSFSCTFSQRLPGEKTFNIYSSGQNGAIMEASVDIDTVGKRFIVKGKTRAPLGEVEPNCCSQDFVSELVRLNENTRCK